MVRVALVGYTNVGKSTIMQLLSKADVFAENKLFATVDSTVRKIVINQIPFLLTDTVGFIRKLPHALVECFKSTLDEIREADMLIHVVDVSHPSFEEQIDIVNSTLLEINAAEKPTILVFNKVDKYQGKSELTSTFIGKGNHETVFISATKKKNIEQLREVIFHFVSKKHYTIFPNFLKNNHYFQ